ncbi:TonB-dependent receptor [Mucilaginibacter arboris]|uniref:TonB-dependent receptor-like beta-barrel domain-containing protein n=1 Tax=Mucilaginibacter arboris TaxID=2682090 RepID=A0A7K1SUW2_9SPHI|nr:TonB-dependent receptor [Mucilaginibacter arboris]MVN21115.1 hypothetical protein [Mucilaginibacter arboris]
MKLKYILTVLLFGLMLHSVPAFSQQKPAQKKTVSAKAKKTVAPKNTVPVKTTNATKKSTVKTASSDTTKKAGNAAVKKPEQQQGLNEEIIVNGTYKPVLADAVKIRRNPNLDDRQDFKPAFTYTNLLDKRLDNNTGIRPLDPIQLPKTADDTLYNNYAKAGVGNLKTTFGELYINNGRDDALQVGGYAKHFAQQGSLPKQNTSRQDIGIFGKSVGDNNSVSGRIDYNRRNNYFYGFDQDNPPAKLTPGKQHFNTIAGEAEIAKNFKDVENDFVYAVKVSGYVFNNAYKAKENNILVNVSINQTIKQFYAGLNASLDAGSIKDSAYSITNNILRANPYLKLQGDNYKIDLGVNLVSVFGFNTSFRIFPAAKIEFQVIPKYVRIFGELQGDVNKTLLRNLTEENPFLDQNIDIKNSINRYTISAGLKGTLAPGLGFKAAFIRQNINSMPLFVNNFNFSKGQNKFIVIYDGGKSTVTGFNGDLDFKASETLDIFGKLEYRKYAMATQAEAWNLPTAKLTAGTNIHLNKKITINGSLLIRGETKDRIPTSATAFQVVTLPSFADLNGGVDYKITKRISLFAQANNLLNNKYQTYLYYPAYGFNIFGGASIGF